MQYYFDMSLARSRITSQGQISVPAEIRRRLGVGPGSVVEWDVEGEKITIKRIGRYNFEDIRSLFDGAQKLGPDDVKEGIRKHMREKYAKR